MNSLKLLLIAGGFAAALSCAARAADVHQAARAGDCAQLRELLDRDPALVNARDEGQDTPLHVAAMMGSMEAVVLLLQRGADADARNTIGQSPLLYAAYNGYAAIVDTFIARRAPFEFRDTRGFAPMDFAARQGRTDVVKLLIEKGARFDERGNQGKTPLYLAAANGHAEIVRLLAARGAKLDTRDEKGDTPLTAALRDGHVGAAGLLIDGGSAIEGDAAALGAYMNRAAAAGSRPIVDALIARGAPAGAKDEGGRTLLHNAAIGGLADLVGELVDRPGNLNAADSRGKTALHHAVAAGRDDIAALLLERGADPNVRDAVRRTPLHAAEDAGRIETAHMLRARGARDIERHVYRLGPAPSGAAGKQGTAPLEVAFFGNEGFLVSRGEKKVLLDAIFRHPRVQPSIDDRVFGMMLEDRPPFDGVDLCVASHVHSDHVNPRMIGELLKRNGGVAFVSSPETCDSVRAAAGSGFEAIAGRIVTVDPAWKEIEKLRLNGIDVAFFGVNHSYLGQEPHKTLAAVVDFDGIRIVHLADEIAGSNVEIFEALDLARDGIDVAFADKMFLVDSIGQHLMKEHIKPTHIILMHAEPDELDAAERDLPPLHPNIIIFREPLERKLFAY